MKVRVEAVGEATSLSDRKRRAGQRLMIGLLKPQVDEDLRRLVAEIRPMGFVLFARNLVEPEQARELCRELSSLADPHDPVLIATDHEGGRVRRLPEPATAWPSMRTLGNAADSETERLAERVGLAMAQELRALGFSLNLAPVADVDGGGDSGIGDRSFGTEPDRVASAVASWLRGLHEGGVAGCAKHFPGLGGATKDSHRELPVIEREVPELRERDLPPFASAIAAGVEVVMVGHGVYPAWDEERPASLSSRIVPQVLRKELGFGGVVLSDDLEMGAVKALSLEERARRACAADIDVLMSCDDPETQYGLFRELVLAQEEEPTLDKRARDAVRRVERLRERALLREASPVDLGVLGSLEHRMLAQLVRARGEGS